MAENTTGYGFLNPHSLTEVGISFLLLLLSSKTFKEILAFKCKVFHLKDRFLNNVFKILFQYV